MGAQYVNRDLSVDCKSTIGIDIKKIDASTAMRPSLFIDVAELFPLKLTWLISLQQIIAASAN